MPVREVTTKPTFGRKNDVPADDESLVRAIDAQGMSFTAYEVDGSNTSYRRQKSACSKSYGYTAFSNSVITSVSGVTISGCLGLHELDDGVNVDNLYFDKGQVFYYDSSDDPQQLNNAYLDYDGQSANFTHGETITGATSSGTAVVRFDSDSGSAGILYLQDVTGTFENDETISGTLGGVAVVNGVLQTTTFAADAGDLYSTTTYGSYVIFSDNMEHTPYRWKNGDQRLVPLIAKASATQYKFKYVMEFRGRIIGAYSDQTDGELEVRWTNAIPNVNTLYFPSANAVDIPETITGISAMGADRIYVYTLNNVFKLDYQPDQTIQFGVYPAVAGQGCTSHHSIVNINGTNFFFNRNLGFVAYGGGTTIDSRDIISKDIEGYIKDIDLTYASRIVGRYIPYDDVIVWLVPGASDADLIEFDLQSGSWSILDKGATVSYIDAWTTDSTAGRKLVFGQTDGHVYKGTGDIAGSESTFTGGRTEPIMWFGDRERLDLLLEVWFGIHTGGDYNLHVYWRGGNTVKECLAASWLSQPVLNLNSPDDAVVYMNKNVYAVRFNQIKWETDGNSEPFAINSIKYAYVIQGKY